MAMAAPQCLRSARIKAVIRVPLLTLVVCYLSSKLLLGEMTITMTLVPRISQYEFKVSVVVEKNFFVEV